MPDGELETGSLLNERYRIQRVIGRGGMGTVYLAEHVRLGTAIAVKEIRGKQATGTAQYSTIEGYEQEARILVRLNHLNLPKVTDAFVDAERLYLVMDYIEGETLDSKLRSGNGRPLPVTTVLEYGIQIAVVLGYLHSQDPPIIFRDLKPANVMVQPDGVIKLIDFGIARRFQPGASQDTALLGSVGYCPPEQFGRHQTDTRSDLYALGATLHQLLTAREPSATPFKFIPAERANPEVTVALSRLVERCVSMDADQRPSTAMEVEDSLKAILEDYRRSADRRATGSLNAHKKQPRGASSGLRLAAVLVGIMAVAGIAGAVYFTSRPPANSVPAQEPAHPRKAAPVAPVAPPISNPVPPPGTVNPTPEQTGRDVSAAPTTGAPANTSECHAEVLGITTDRLCLRVHITGRILDHKSQPGMAAVYFYSQDKSPLKSRDPHGAYASPTGQLYAEFTFPIDADDKVVDGTVDVPLNQFAQSGDMLFRCIIYADNQSAAETPLTPLLSNNLPSVGPR